MDVVLRRTLAGYGRRGETISVNGNRQKIRAMIAVGYMTKPEDLYPAPTPVAPHENGTDPLEVFEDDGGAVDGEENLD